MMRGKPGTEIVLSIIRDDSDKPIEISLKRAIIRVTSVRSRYVDEGIGYLRISQFQHHTARDLDKRWKRCKKREL